MLRKKQRDIIDQQNRIWIIIGAIFGSLIGSRLIGGFENPAALSASTNKLLYIYQNKTIVGGFLGGLAGVELTKKWINEKQASGDLFVYPILRALIIGRIGCFSMGVYEETYGNQTTLPWGLNLGDGVRRHPVALYEIVFLGALWLTINIIRKKSLLINGAVFKIFMICYLLFRFLLDFIKPHFTYSFGLSTIQVTCLAGLMYYYKYILHPQNLLQLHSNCLTNKAPSLNKTH